MTYVNFMLEILQYYDEAAKLIFKAGSARNTWEIQQIVVLFSVSFKARTNVSLSFHWSRDRKTKGHTQHVRPKVAASCKRACRWMASPRHKFLVILLDAMSPQVDDNHLRSFHDCDSIATASTIQQQHCSGAFRVILLSE